MNKKKLGSLLLAGAMALSLAACTPKEAEPTPTPTPSAAPEVKTLTSPP